MTKYIILLSLARQGHHAVIDWICRQPKTAVYYNNCVLHKGEVKLKNFMCSYKKGIEVEKKHLIHGLSIDDSHKNVDVVIYNFINLDPAKYQNLHKLLGLNDATTYCIVVRDIYNSLASMIRKAIGTPGNKVKIWKSLLKTILGDEATALDTEIVDINFNKWFKSVEYREWLSSRLGLKFTDASLGDNNFIGKSVFQKEIVDGSKLDVLHRWKTLMDSPHFWATIDKEAIELCKRYFGFYIDRKTKEVIEC